MQDNNRGRIKFIISSQSCRGRFILCKGHPLQLWAPQPRALSPGALKASSGCLASGSICGKKTFRLVHHATFGHASQIYHLLSADQLLPEWKPYQKGPHYLGHQHLWATSCNSKSPHTWGNSEQVLNSHQKNAPLQPFPVSPKPHLQGCKLCVCAASWGGALAVWKNLFYLTVT